MLAGLRLTVERPRHVLGGGWITLSAKGRKFPVRSTDHADLMNTIYFSLDIHRLNSGYVKLAVPLATLLERAIGRQLHDFHGRSLVDPDTEIRTQRLKCLLLRPDMSVCT